MVKQKIPTNGGREGKGERELCKLIARDKREVITLHLLAHVQVKL